MRRSYNSLSPVISYYNPIQKQKILLTNHDTLQTYFNNNLKVTQLIKENTGSIIFKLQRRGS